VVGDENGHSVEVRGPQFKVPWKNLKVIGYGDDAKDSRKDDIMTEVVDLMFEVLQ
jgi:hypothetical protein